MNLKTQSYWMSEVQGPAYPRLEGSRPLVDVAIIGAGISGLTAAILLKQAGLRVAVIEKSRVGSGESGHTSAHLTEIVDTRYHRIESRFGSEGAHLVAHSSRAAIDLIARLAEGLSISCGFKKLPGYLYAERFLDVWSCRQEMRSAQAAGVKAAWTRDVPLPFRVRGALRVENQACFHPVRYLLGLARAVHGDGCTVFENSPVSAFSEGNPCGVITPDGQIAAKSLFVATHSPNSSPYPLQLKVAAYRSYCVSAQLSQTPPQPGLYWDMRDPYHYIREDNGAWIVGGEDHKAGKNDRTDSCFRNLRDYVRSHLGPADFRHSWSGQIMETADGLPYIGQNPLSEHVYVATGFSGNGLTFGTIAGMLIFDLILRRANAWEPLYRPSRIRPPSSGPSLLSENKDFPIYRDPQGQLHAVSAECTHMGCHVQWNSAEKSWDCPCHGSRFDVDGKMVNGPAVLDLAPAIPAVKEKEAPTKKPA